AMELHPDRNPGNPEAENKFKEASEAYQVLADPERRASYDRFGHAGPAQGFGPGFNDIGDIFSAFSDIFAEAAVGITKEVKVKRRAPCGACRGSGAQAGSTPEICQQCGGRGQVMHSQGFLMISTTCPVCRGEGRVIRTPCSECQVSGIDHP